MGTSATTSPTRRTLRRGNGAEPQTLDPSLANGAQDDYIIADLMMGLTTEDIRAQPIPGMAPCADHIFRRTRLDVPSARGAVVGRRARHGGGLRFARQRLLDPTLAAPYAYFLYLVKNATSINAGKMRRQPLGARRAMRALSEVQLEHPAPYMVEMLMHRQHLSPAAPCGDSQGR